MKFNRKHLEELTLQKIKEVNDEAGYRKYLEVPEMVNIIASIIEEKFVDNRWEKCADDLVDYAHELAHIKKPYSLEEIIKQYSSGSYNAEQLLQHAVLLLTK